MLKKIEKLFFKINKKNKKSIYLFKEIDEISPGYINESNPKFIEIDDMFFSTILIINYYREQNDLILNKIIDSNINLNISIFYEKQETYKTIKELTFNIGNVGVDVHKNNINREDAEIVNYTYDDARYIRKEMQINNEELYYLYIYVNVFSKNKDEIEYLLNKVEGILQSQGMQTRRAYFREEQAFLSCLPFMINNNDVKEVSKRNILTNGIISTYPFVSSSIFDEYGIYIGKNIYNKSMIFIDRYDEEKYKNANMCVLGTSRIRKIILHKA